MRFQNVVNGFRAGVLAPRVSLRSDTQQYSQALKQSENFILAAQGGALFRQGNEFVGESANSDAPYRIFQFHKGGDRSDILIEVTAGVTRYWQNGDFRAKQEPFEFLLDEDDGFQLLDENDGFALGELRVETDTNPYSQEDLEGLYFGNQDKFGILVHDDHPPYIMTFEPDGTIIADILDFNRVPRYDYKDVKSPSGVADNTSYEVTFPADWTSSGNQYQPRFAGYNRPQGVLNFEYQSVDSGGAENNRIRLENELNGLIGEVFTAGNPQALVSYVAPSGQEPTPITYTVAFAGPNAGLDFKVENRSGDGQLITVLEISADRTNDEPAWSYPYVVENNAEYYICIQRHLSDSISEDINEPGVGVDWEVYWLLFGPTPPTWWDYQHGGANPWDVDTPYAPWNRGFPTVTTFHQQRLYFAANEDNPTGIYASAIANFNFFQTGPEDDDPFIFVLDSIDAPKIKWMQSQFDLLVGTSSGDYLLQAQVSLGPADVSARRQNNARSINSRSVTVDTQTFYVEQGETKVRYTEYERNRLGFSSIDASLQAENLLYGGVRRLTIQRIPEMLITALHNDGTLCFLSFDPLHVNIISGQRWGSLAWSSSSSANRIVDIAAYYDARNREDWLFVVVENNGRYYTERMRYPQRNFSSATDLTSQGVVHLDSSAVGTVSGGRISGLTWLNEQTVVVLLDDAWEGEYTVSNNEIRLSDEDNGKTYAVGLPYTGTLETYEVARHPQDGTGHGGARRWNRLSVRILDSALPLINQQRAADRTPGTPMGTGETVRLGIQDVVTNNLGFGDGSVLMIQDRPYPTHILGLFGEYRVETK